MVFAIFSAVCFFLVPWPVCPPHGFLVCFVVLLRIRGCRDPNLLNSYQPQPVCCLVFFLYSESISGLDALHTVPNSGFVHTLPTEQASSAQQILFARS